MRITTRSLIFVIVITLIAVVLTGCGSKENTSLQTVTSTETQPARKISAVQSQVEVQTGSISVASLSASPESAREGNMEGASVVQPQESATVPTRSMGTSRIPADNPAADESSMEQKASVDDTDPGDVFSQSIQVLQTLSSYQYAMVIKYDSTESSVSDSGTVIVVGEYVVPIVIT